MTTQEKVRHGFSIRCWSPAMELTISGIFLATDGLLLRKATARSRSRSDAREKKNPYLSVICSILGAPKLLARSTYGCHCSLKLLTTLSHDVNVFRAAFQSCLQLWLPTPCFTNRALNPKTRSDLALFGYRGLRSK